MSSSYVRVGVGEPLGPLDYSVPDSSHTPLRPGSLVRVPLGQRRVVGVVMECLNEPAQDLDAAQIKDIIEPLVEHPPIPEAILKVIKFGTDYYGVPLGDFVKLILPAIVKEGSRRYGVNESATTNPVNLNAEQSKLVAALRDSPRPLTAKTLGARCQLSTSSARARLERLVKQGVLVHHTATKTSARMVATWQRQGHFDAPAKGQLKEERLYNLWLSLPPDAWLTTKAVESLEFGNRSRLKTLESRSLVATRQEAQTKSVDFAIETDIPTLTPHQDAAFATLSKALGSQTFKPYLLHGVTGSGKTEIYLRLIDRCLKVGKSALVLVPEIALTPQLSGQFRGRFGDQVATFHSGLSPAERRDEWERVSNGGARIGVGARSALWLPMHEVGVIIIDEEHESSFKQDEQPRYHARDLAILRAREEGALVVLGSATPSFESFQNAKSGRYELLTLPERIGNRPMPEATVIDMVSADKVGSGVLSQAMVDGLTETLHQKRQSILFLNRRGFSPFVACRDCGHSFRCDDCDVSLTFYQRRHALNCHYCGIHVPMPETCPNCEGHNLEPFGVGTERLEDELRGLLPDARIARLDRDIVRSRKQLEDLLERVRHHEIDILIGTQMVAKGHDFPNVTFVGIISADSSLNFPDFRAAERTFQLISQVAGRAGRREEPGRVLIQALEPNHSAIQAALTYDFDSFFDEELPNREDLHYPPFGFLALIRIESESESNALRASAAMAKALKATEPTYPSLVLGPAPAPITRLKSIFRMQILVKSPTRKDLRQILGGMKTFGYGGVKVVVDIDPMNML